MTWNRSRCFGYKTAKALHFISKEVKNVKNYSFNLSALIFTHCINKLCINKLFWQNGGIIILESSNMTISVTQTAFCICFYCDTEDQNLSYRKNARKTKLTVWNQFFECLVSQTLLFRFHSHPLRHFLSLSLPFFEWCAFRIVPIKNVFEDVFRSQSSI